MIPSDPLDILGEPDLADEIIGDYGFCLPKAPSYRLGQVGDWRIVARPQMISQEDTYLSHSAVEPAHHVLYQDSEAWMATSLLERQSHAWHVEQANGVVVIAGLGLGMYALQAAAKPEVDMVVVGEIAPEVIELFTTCIEADPVVLAKIRILQADVREPGFADQIRQVIGDRKPGYLYTDIWPDYPNPEGPDLTSNLVKALQPVAAGWWGQELAFGLWCEEQSRACDFEALHDFFAGAEVPIQPTTGYLAFCRDAIEIAGLDLERAPAL